MQGILLTIKFLTMLNVQDFGAKGEISITESPERVNLSANYFEYIVSV